MDPRDPRLEGMSFRPAGAPAPELTVDQMEDAGFGADINLDVSHPFSTTSHRWSYLLILMYLCDGIYVLCILFVVFVVYCGAETDGRNG